jgi:glutamate--cysteine ligase
LLTDWAQEICAELEPLAERLDAGLDEPAYARVVANAQAAIADPDRTPSARLLAELHAEHESFFELAQRYSTAHQRYYRERYPLSAEQQQRLQQQARASLRAQAQLEASDDLSFDEYLSRYFAGIGADCNEAVAP